MINLRQFGRGARFAVLLAAALAISACAKDTAENAQANATGQAALGAQMGYAIAGSAAPIIGRGPTPIPCWRRVMPTVVPANG